MVTPVATHTRPLDHLLSIAAAGTVIVSVVPLLGSSWWIFELFSHFRAQYLLTQLCLLALLFHGRRWRWCSILLPFMAVNALALAPYWPRPVEQGPVEGHLTVMTANVNIANADYQSFLDLVTETPPDMLLVVEINAAWTAAISELADLYPHQVRVPRSDEFGIALLSRIPLGERQSRQLGTTAAIDVRARHAGREIRIIGAHLKPPVTTAWAEERNRQLAELAALAREEADPLLVIGDFNITPYSPLFTRYLEPSGLRDARRARGWTFSWPTFLPLLGIPIDHCLISKQFAVLDHRRGRAFGSDHYPVTVELALRAAT